MRLKYSDGFNINQNTFENKLGNIDQYKFNWILYVGRGNNIPIVNYTFDPSDNSLILKLYEPIPSNIQKLEIVTLEREVLTTQIDNIYYFSEVPDVFFGDGLAFCTISLSGECTPLNPPPLSLGTHSTNFLE